MKWGWNLVLQLTFGQVYLEIFNLNLRKEPLYDILNEVLIFTMIFCIAWRDFSGDKLQETLEALDR